jgi:hypothetical protein
MHRSVKANIPVTMLRRNIITPELGNGLLL